MNLSTLQFAPTVTLPVSFSLYRVQRQRARPGSLKVGALRLPPLSIRAGRFDLQSVPVGYFAETPETAGYETIARREMTMASLRAIGQRTLICFETREPLNMLDLRPHASTWPVLQSLRFSQTQMLAEDVNKSGFDGIIYRSAQQFGLDCFAVFGAHLERLRVRWSQPLVHPKTGQLHSVVASVLAGSQIDLVP